jgi:hydroxymethylpyrimidine/phosphomethylpyrimidine kinase
MTAITAITAQNTVGVSAIEPVPPEIILAQVRAVARDIGVDAVKVGMVGSADGMEAVSRALGELPSGTPVVVDPVLMAGSGDRLLDPDARAALVELVLARATVATPNLPEARELAAGASGGTSDPASAPASAPAEDSATLEALARAIHDLGPRAVVITGGHGDPDEAGVTDIFFDGRTLTAIPGERHPDAAAHGSGCTHSSALAAHLALGLSALDAARAARELTGRAVRDGLSDVGDGPGPVDVWALGSASRRERTGHLR